MNWRITALIAALYGLLAVVLAALGAHLLPMNEPGAAKLWATALQMHLFHAAALLAVAALAASRRSAFMSWSGLLMAAGVCWALFFVVPCVVWYRVLWGVRLLLAPLSLGTGCC